MSGSLRMRIFRSSVCACPRRGWLLVAFAAIGLGLLVQALHALFNVGHPGFDGLIEHGLYTAVEWVCVVVCAARGLWRREDRLAWLLIAAGLLTWAAGDLAWTVWLDDLKNPPDPSIADALYLSWYPAIYVALVLLIRSHRAGAGLAMWLDGLVVGLALGALGAALVFADVLGSLSGGTAAVAVNLAYPFGDLLLLAFVALGIALAGWRLNRQWGLLAGGLAMSAAADMVYLDQIARGTYVGGRILDVMWPASMALIAASAWAPTRRHKLDSAPATATVALPALAALASLGLLVDATVEHLTPLCVALATSALIAAGARVGLTYLENIRMLKAQRRHAITDALTDLGNRRRLNEELELTVAQANESCPATIVFFDLDGFKRYNDGFGHGAGDALLARLGIALQRAVAGHGRAYRLGGDEFCVLLNGRLSRHDDAVAQCVRALSEQGDGFAIRPSCGLVHLPEEAGSATLALALADKRMYADKGSGGRESHAQAQSVLMRLLSEREPTLHRHVRDVGSLALAVGRQLGMDSEQLDELRRAAELHDVGKLAIPEAILRKHGTLNESERAFMEQHTLIGERVLDVAPALSSVARLVRSSHERWDGHGYPDHLAAEQIPLGARVISVCDAYTAMLTARPPRPARSPKAALQELLLHSGSQFDPDVVAALRAHLNNSHAQHHEHTDAGVRPAG